MHHQNLQLYLNNYLYFVFLASGTSWESGVRRSTRIRSRPLEYWKGERFLYGRVHESKYFLMWNLL